MVDSIDSQNLQDYISYLSKINQYFMKITRTFKASLNDSMSI